MRNKAVYVISVFLIAIMIAAPCLAEDKCGCKAKNDHFGMKLGWGIVNLIMAPVEVIKGATCAPDERGMAYDVPHGVGKGFCNMMKRFGVGTYEIATCPVHTMSSYDPLCEERNKCGGSVGAQMAEPTLLDKEANIVKKDK